nr:MAG TPA: hypothetical protein [Podoviridae sp. ctgHy19]
MIWRLFPTRCVYFRCAHRHVFTRSSLGSSC